MKMAVKKDVKINIKGDIQIHTENILPIIKKWLYSEHEIFLRELVSNSFDAISKLQKIKNVEKLEDMPEKGLINIKINEKEKTIHIIDNGLGMDAEEIQKYINQIAFSGAEDFIKKYKDKEENKQIIGHFGLGFYSSFMVADQVEIRTKSYQKKARAISWICDGSTHFEIKETNQKDIGTEVILTISEENKGFLHEGRIIELVKKYANFLPVEIQVNGQKQNDENPLWVKQPQGLAEKDYQDFYQKLYPFTQEPLFNIHLNVDYPFNLKGILYFPKIMHELDAQKSQVSLYCHQVFVTDNAKDVLPEFLTLLRGVIDCPDLPLNVSRSYLQKDPYVQKISKHIVKKVADKLKTIFNNDREKYEKYWEEIHPFIKYGMMSDNDFYEKVKDLVIFKSTSGKATTIPEYLERAVKKHKDTIIYATDKAAQAAYINMYQEQGMEVVFVSSAIGYHFIQFLESKDSSIKYKAVDSEILDDFVDKEKEAKVVDAKDNKTQSEKIEEIFKRVLADDKLKIQIQSLKNDQISAMLTESEQMKRLKAMSSFMNQDGNNALSDYTLIINSNNKVVQNVLKLNEGLDAQDRAAKLVKHVYDLARMSQKQLVGEELQEFLLRSNELLS
jgi:molecular chaperone HtpG